LELRKRLLIAESELNREQMMRDLHAFKGGILQAGEQVKHLGSIAKSVGGIVSSVAAVMAALSAFRRRSSPGREAKTSWWQLLLKNAGLLSSLWLAWRAPKSKQIRAGLTIP
jgi:hypothetical protein